MDGIYVATHPHVLVLRRVDADAQLSSICDICQRPSSVDLYICRPCRYSVCLSCAASGPLVNQRFNTAHTAPTPSYAHSVPLDPPLDSPYLPTCRSARRAVIVAIPDSHSAALTTTSAVRLRRFLTHRGYSRTVLLSHSDEIPPTGRLPSFFNSPSFPSAGPIGAPGAFPAASLSESARISAITYPSRANILRALVWLVSGLGPSDSIVFAFLGPPSMSREGLLCADGAELSPSDLATVLFSRIPHGANLFALFDVATPMHLPALPFSTAVVGGVANAVGAPYGRPAAGAAAGGGGPGAPPVGDGGYVCPMPLAGGVPLAVSTGDIVLAGLEPPLASNVAGGYFRPAHMEVGAGMLTAALLESAAVAAGAGVDVRGVGASRMGTGPGLVTDTHCAADSVMPSAAPARIRLPDGLVVNGASGRHSRTHVPRVPLMRNAKRVFGAARVPPPLPPLENVLRTMRRATPDESEEPMWRTLWGCCFAQTYLVWFNRVTYYGLLSLMVLSHQLW